MRPQRTSEGSLDTIQQMSSGAYTTAATSPELTVSHAGSGTSLIARRGRRQHERVLSGEVSPADPAARVPSPDGLRIALPETPNTGPAAPPEGRGSAITAMPDLSNNGGASRRRDTGSRTPQPAGLPPRPPSPLVPVAPPGSADNPLASGSPDVPSPPPQTTTGSHLRLPTVRVTEPPGTGREETGGSDRRRNVHGRTASMVAATGADGAPSPPPVVLTTPTTRLQFSAVRGEHTAGALPPAGDGPVETRSVGTQTAQLSEGFVARRGTHMATPAFLLLGGPTLLLIGGVSYGHYWRVLYASIGPDEAPAALSAYVAFLFLGFFLLNIVVFPMTLRVIASPLSTRSQKRYFRGASLIFGFLIALPMAMCELLLLNDSDANAGVLGLTTEERASVFALIALLTLGTVFVWLAYVNWMVDTISRIVRKEAFRMIQRDGVEQLHQRPGTQMPSVTKYAIAMSSRRRARRSRSAATQAHTEVQMNTVSRPLSFQSPETPATGGAMR